MCMRSPNPCCSDVDKHWNTQFSPVRCWLISIYLIDESLFARELPPAYSFAYASCLSTFWLRHDKAARKRLLSQSRADDSQMLKAMALRHKICIEHPNVDTTDILYMIYNTQHVNITVLDHLWMINPPLLIKAASLAMAGKVTCSFLGKTSWRSGQAGYSKGFRTENISQSFNCFNLWYCAKSRILFLIYSDFFPNA